MLPQIPAGWPGLQEETQKPYFQELASFVNEEQTKSQPVYPPEDDIFQALELTPRDSVRAVILGQDPYHGLGQAHGLAFSVRPGVPPPPSLKNIFKELCSDVQVCKPPSGDLRPWARQGVLLLNAALTVRQSEPNSHAGKGWEVFTDRVFQIVNAGEAPVVFVLWGAFAQKKAPLIASRHGVIASAHPSPLSARNGFFGSRPFSRVNEFLTKHGRGEIDWRL